MSITRGTVYAIHPTRSLPVHSVSHISSACDDNTNRHETKQTDSPSGENGAVGLHLLHDLALGLWTTLVELAEPIFVFMFSDMER